MTVLSSKKLTFAPVTIGNWKDFENLFGKRGACGGCWCMYWRLTRTEFEKQKGDGNKKAMKKIVRSGDIPGILAYYESQPIGWCSVAPREKFSSLERSRILKPVDNKKVWSINCLFIKKQFRRAGLSVKLIKAAVDYVRSQGGTIVEAYPVEPRNESMPDVFAYTGLANGYLRAGFKEILRRSETRPIMRRSVRKKHK